MVPFFLFALCSAAAEMQTPLSVGDYQELALVPVQSSGRIKPLDSFARERVLQITGKRQWKEWDPVALMLSWISNPALWQNEPFILVLRQDVRRQLGLDENRSHFSPNELLQGSHLGQYATTLGSERMVPADPRGAVGGKESPREGELKQVLDRILTFQRLVSGEAWTVVAVHDHPEAPWTSLAREPEEGSLIRAQFNQVLAALKQGDGDLLYRFSRLLRATVEGESSEWTDGNRRDFYLEYVYNHLRLFHWSWIFYAVASVLWILPLRALRVFARSFAWAGVGAHVLGFGLRCWIAGRPPVSNMYESIIWVSFGVILFAVFVYRSKKNRIVFPIAFTMAALGLLAADAAPALLDPGIHPLVPVLRSNYWLTIHVLTITLGYAAFALSLGIGNVVLFQYLKGRGGRASAFEARAVELNQLMYRAIQFGVVLLAAGTILGGVWADYSWGRFWGWDPKETWALIALLGYVAVLHARYTGWIGTFGFAATSVLGFLFVVMAWYGVNFVLGAGLHSYGFSSGGQGVVALFSAAQILFVGAAYLFGLRHLNIQSVKSKLLSTASGTSTPPSERSEYVPVSGIRKEV